MCEEFAEYIGMDLSETTKIHKDKYEIVTRIAFLCGVKDKILEESEFFLPEIIKTLKYNGPAQIVRDLCMLRNSIEHNYKRISDAMTKDGRSFYSLSEYIPIDSLTRLSDKNVKLPVTSKKTDEIIIEINKALSDRINNCKDIFPSWIKWEYIKDLFIMPNGLKKEGIQAAANLFYESMDMYPFGVYINWPPMPIGNLFASDFKFTKSIYQFHGEDFKDSGKVSDTSDEIKDRIYNFIDASETCILVVDCENSDPYSLCAMFNCLDDNQVAKIDKIVLYDDPQAPSGWKFFDQHVSLEKSKIEHIMIKRILDYKSLLDVKLSSRVTCEFYKNHVDSFVLVSSDSDFWGLIEELPDAKFLIMLEHQKASTELKKVLEEKEFFYCYTDNFYSGMDDSFKKQAIFAELTAFFNEREFNLREVYASVLEKTRVRMADGEFNQFYDKHLRGLSLSVDKEGNVKFEIKK